MRWRATRERCFRPLFRGCRCLDAECGRHVVGWALETAVAGLALVGDVESCGALYPSTLAYIDTGFVCGGGALRPGTPQLASAIAADAAGYADKARRHFEIATRARERLRREALDAAALDQQSAICNVWDYQLRVGIRPALPTDRRRCYAARMVRYRIKQARPSRASEAAVEYKVPSVQGLQVPGVYHVTVTDRGRLVLPAEVRAKLKIRDGDRVAVAIEEDGTISVTTRDVAISHLRGMFKRPGKQRRLASDELIAERRREARKDDREFREWDARLRKAGK